MKKLVIVIALVLVFASLCTVLVACGGNTNNGDNNGLVYNKKYIRILDSDSRLSDLYFIIQRNGTAKFHYTHKLNENYISSYTINCKWTTLDDTSIVLSYDSVEYDEIDTTHYDQSTADFVLVVSRNVILKTTDTFYNEDYLKNEIKNFGKTAE